MRCRVVCIAISVLSCCAPAEEQKPAIEFLDKTAAATAILDDKTEPYFETLQPVEMGAKTAAPISGETLAEQRAECRKRYKDAVLDFTADEKAVLTWAIEKAAPHLQEFYPRYAKVPWSFIKVGDAIEGGFPHTRGAHIVVSQRAVTRFVRMKDKLPEAAALPGIASVLLHEQFHVFQRGNEQLIGKLYTDVWGFKHVDTIESCDWLVARHLSNPDGVDCRWIFPITDGDKTRYILPLVIFAAADTPQRMGADFRSVALDLEKTDTGYRVMVGTNKEPALQPLDDIPEYRAKFGHYEEDFHPNEISAEMFARIVSVDALLPKDKLAPEKLALIEKEFAPVRKWLRENLK